MQRSHYSLNNKQQAILTNNVKDIYSSIISYTSSLTYYTLLVSLSVLLNYKHNYTIIPPPTHSISIPNSNHSLKFQQIIQLNLHNQNMTLSHRITRKITSFNLATSSSPHNLIHIINKS